MKRPRAFLRRLLWTLAILLAIGVPLYLFVLPWYVRREIIAALSEAGIADARLDVAHLSPWRLGLANLHLGDFARADGTAVEARFSPGRLWNQGIESVRFTDLELSADLANGRFTAGPFTHDLVTTRPSTHPATHNSLPRGLRLPVDRIELASSFLTLRLPARSVRLAIAGTLTRREDGRHALDLTIAPDSQNLRLTGTIGPASDEMELTAGCDAADLALLGEIATAARPSLDIHGGGFLRIEDMRIRNTMGRASLGGRLKPDAASVIVRRPGKPADSEKPLANFAGITGVYGFRVAFGPDNPGGRATINLSDAAFSGKSWGIDVEGLSGKIVFSDLTNLQTDGVQTIHVAKASIGDLAFAGGTIEAAMNSAKSMLIYKTRWTCFDGALSAEWLKLDLTGSAWDLKFKMDNADVKQILSLVAPQRINGEGRVSGQLAARVQWPNIRIDLGELRCTPGGTFQVKDFSAMAKALGAAVATDERVKKKIFEALGDFRYDILKVELKRTAGGLSAYMDIVGRGRTGDKQALHVEPTITGLDPVLDLVLGLQRRMSQFGPDN